MFLFPKSDKLSGKTPGEKHRREAGLPETWSYWLLFHGPVRGLD